METAMWGNNQPPMIGGPELTEGLTNYHKAAEDYRRRCAAKRAREEEWKNELAWLDKVAAKSRTTEATETKIKPDAVRKTDVGNGAGGLVFKTRDDARVASESPKQPAVTPPVVAPNETAVWWQWTSHNLSEWSR
jgi:hypothetical protein